MKKPPAATINLGMEQPMNDRRLAVGFILFLSMLAVGYFVFQDLKQHWGDELLQQYGSRVNGRVAEAWQPGYGLRNSAGGSKVLIPKGAGSGRPWFIGTPLKAGDEVALLIIPEQGLCDRAEDVATRLKGWPWSSVIPIAPLVPVSYALFFWLMKRGTL